MATTLPEASALLDSLGLAHRVTDRGVIVFGVETERYRSPEGESGLTLVLALEEDGEYFKLYAPDAFSARGTHADAVLRACAMVQWRTKLIQFEFDESDGEVRAIVEFPLEDAGLTQRQLRRCVAGLVGLLEAYYPVIARAVETGEVSFDDAPNGLVTALGEMLSHVPPDILADALRQADERRRHPKD